jgi:hypothetical protein
MAQPTSSRPPAEGAARAADSAARAADDTARAADDAARAADDAARAAREPEPVVVVQAPAVSTAYQGTYVPVIYQTMQAPIVYRRRRSRGKKKYSRGLKAPQKLEQDASRSVERVAEAVTDGIREYRDSRDRSARRKRDGAIKDVVRNVGRGLSEALDTGSRAPSDLTRRATMKRLTRVFVPPPFSYFMRGR